MHDDLTPAQNLAAEMIGQGFGPREVAKRLGVSRETIHRWAREPEFQIEAAEASKAKIASIRRSGLRKLGRITKALESIVLDEVTVEDEVTGEPITRPRAKDADRIAAADRLLKVHGLMREAVEVSGPNGAPVALDVRESLVEAARSLSDADLGLTDEPADERAADEE